MREKAAALAFFLDEALDAVPACEGGPVVPVRGLGLPPAPAPLLGPPGGDPVTGPLFDAGNSLLGSVPVQLDTGSVDGPAGKIGVITLRTASTTLTAFLAPGELRKWAALLSGLADEMAGGLTVASAVDIAALERRRAPS